jgi:biopolymer transport protein ExbD
MKSQNYILPLCDLVFLCLGGVLAAMTQMEIVNALPVEVTQVGKGSAVVRHDKFKILSLTDNQIVFDGQIISEQQLTEAAANQKVVLRVPKALPTERTVRIIALLAKANAQVSIEVNEINESLN